ncbi:hypothetical protein GGF32_002683 [Allomyces javanicus]|nr:hypothetical protein GGF32_002683 [Allomyces javanicus]
MLALAMMLATSMSMWTYMLESLRPLEPAHVSDIRGQLHNMTVWRDRAQFFSALQADTDGAKFFMAAHPGFQDLVQSTMVMSIAASSTLDAVRHADMSTLVSGRMAHGNTVFVIQGRVLGMSNREIAHALAVELGLPLTGNGGLVPMTLPLMPSCGTAGSGVDGAVRLDSATDEALVDLVELYINALLLLHTDPADLEVLVDASAELCTAQAAMCWKHVVEAEALADAQARVYALARLQPKL